MATLEKIRNKGGVLVIIFVGLALFAFLLTDFLSSGKTLFHKANSDVGEIDGTSITIEDYQKELSEWEEWTKMQYGKTSLDENTTFRVQDQTWDQIVRERLLTEQYNLLGLDVTDDEMLDMLTGKEVHQGIRQMFTDPKTGVFNKQAVIESYRNRQQNPQANFYWYFSLKQIKQERLYNKYTALLKKGMYVTGQHAKFEAAAKQKQVSFDYIVKRLSSVSDSSLTITNDEIKSYYKNHMGGFKQVETRDIEYVTFEVVPTEEDNQLTKASIEKLRERLADPSANISQVINMNSDNGPYAEKNLTLNEIPLNLKGFVASASVGDIYGPIEDGDTYKLAKLVAVRQLPDSVKARHILVRAETPNAAKVADSLLSLAKRGADFAELARTNSQDQGSAINGGDLGWFKEGLMVKPFNDACFKGSKGEIVKVESQFGFHIINIQDIGKTAEKYELAVIEKKVTYSQKTYNQIYSSATKFASNNGTRENFEKSVKAENLTPRFGRDIKANDRTIGSLDSPRELVKWAFSSNLNDVSPIFEFGNQFVFAVLTSEKEAGHANIDDVKSQIRSELANEKKTEKLVAEMKTSMAGTQDLTTLAQKTGTSVQSAADITFGSFQVPGAGVEPALVAWATQSLNNGSLSGPVAGINGVYVIKVNGIKDLPLNTELEKTQLTQSGTYKVDYKAFEALKANVEVVDKRSKFY